MKTQLHESAPGTRMLQSDTGERTWIAVETMWLMAIAAETGGHSRQRGGSRFRCSGDQPRRLTRR